MPGYIFAPIFCGFLISLADTKIYNIDHPLCYFQKQG